MSEPPTLAAAPEPGRQSTFRQIASVVARRLGHRRPARSALRSGADEERFRDEMVGAMVGVPAGGSVVLPGTWVFIPITLGVGGMAAVLMALVAEGNGAAAGALLLAANAGLGILMRRLARSGRLLIRGSKSRARNGATEAEHSCARRPSRHRGALNIRTPKH